MSEHFNPSRSSEVLTDGHRLYVRARRGVYREVDRRGRGLGITCSNFEPRPRWRPARLCTYDIAVDGLTCPRCGLYDNGYAVTGDRSYCGRQKGR